MLWPSYAAAQSPTARLEGTVHDSIRARGAAGAIVYMTRVHPQPSLYFSTVTDDQGRFQFDTLAAGEYLVAFSTERLDSLEITVPSRSVILREGEHARLDLATPSGAALRLAACPGVTLQPGRGAVFGRVVRAETDSAIRGALVVVGWSDLDINPATRRAVTTWRTGAVRTDSLGHYGLCGVPTDVPLALQVQHEGRATTIAPGTVPDDAGVLLRYFSFSSGGSRTFAALDSAGPGAPPTLTGRAALTGVVRNTGGQPVPDARVRIVDAATPAANTDSLGQFTLSGLPSGTQLLDVRRLGYLLAQLPVTLRDDASATQAVVLQRIVSLDSIRVVAQRTRYLEFERRAKTSGFGRFLREEDLAKRHAFETSDLVRDAGFVVEGWGIDAKVISRRSALGLHGSCAANVVIDGMQNQDINLVRPGDIGAIEIYQGSAGAPIQYNSACGLIVIWTKR